MLKIILIVSFSVLILNGCAGSRTKPISDAHPQLIPIPKNFGSLEFEADYQYISIDGWNYDGLLQFPQPWSLSDRERGLIYGNTGKLVAFSLRNELKRQGVKLSKARKSKWILQCKVKSITINTYGMLAGDYWEATVDVNAKLIDHKSRKTVWSQDFSQYAKLEPSPALVDWADLLWKFSKIALNDSVTIPTRDTFDVYKVNGYKVSPVEVAARYVAIDIIKAAANGKRGR